VLKDILWPHGSNKNNLPFRLWTSDKPISVPTNFSVTLCWPIFWCRFYFLLFLGFGLGLKIALGLGWVLGFGIGYLIGGAAGTVDQWGRKTPVCGRATACVTRSHMGQYDTGYSYGTLTLTLHYSAVLKVQQRHG